MRISSRRKHKLRTQATYASIIAENTQKDAVRKRGCLTLLAEVADSRDPHEQAREAGFVR